jgi:hypothetical protein
MGSFISFLGFPTPDFNPAFALSGLIAEDSDCCFSKQSDQCDDLNPIKEKHNERNAIDSEKTNEPAPELAKRPQREGAWNARSHRLPDEVTSGDM